MASSSAVDRAYQRCQILTKLVERARDDALANPTQQRWADVEITSPDDLKADAKKKVEETFGELLNLINHITLIDMAASFERVCRDRLRNQVGLARSALSDRASKRDSNLARYHQRLVHEVDDFEGLAAFGGLLDGYLAKELGEKLKLIREGRNNFAHGTDIKTAPKVARGEVLETLNATLELL